MTFLDCLAFTFCDVIGELLLELACLVLQGGTTFHLMSTLADIPVSILYNTLFARTLFSCKFARAERREN